MILDFVNASTPVAQILIREGPLDFGLSRNHNPPSFLVLAEVPRLGHVVVIFLSVAVSRGALDTTHLMDDHRMVVLRVRGVQRGL